MLERKVGEKETGVSPVIAVILMVAITVVLAGIVYYWVGQLSSTSDESLSYVGFDKLNYDNYWEVTIEKVQGARIPISEVHFFITGINGLVRYKKIVADSNPQPFINEQSKIYPISANSSGVISTKTLAPVTPSDKFDDYAGAIYVIVDIDNDELLNTGDVIKIYADIDGDGTQDIKSGEYFKINNLEDTHEYLKCHL